MLVCFVCVCVGAFVFFSFSLFAGTIYFSQIQRVRSVGSAVISFLWGAFLSVYQQSGEERLNRLLCMANLLSSLNIEVKADLCDCQYTSSSGLCYASEPVK